MTFPASIETRPARSGASRVQQNATCVCLLRAVQAGESTAMDRLLREIRPIAYRASLSMGSRNGAAEDVAQEVLIRTVRHAGRIREPNAFGVWLHRTIRNTHLMHHRRHVHEPASFESLSAAQVPGAGGDPVEPSPDPEAQAILMDARRHLTRAVRAMPAPYRMVLALREFAELSTRDVSHVLGISEPAVKTRLHRARVRLRRLLEEPSFDA